MAVEAARTTEANETERAGAFTWADTARFFAFAIPFRLAILLLMEYPKEGGDIYYYTTVARAIFYHGVHSDSAPPGPFLPTMYRAPLYPAFRALLMYVFGESLLPVQIVQCFISAGTAWLLWRGAHAVSARLGRIARVGMMLCPFEAVFAPPLVSECLTTFFVTAGMTLPWIVRGRWRWVLTGAAFALGALTRDVYMLMFFGLSAFAVLFKVFTDEPGASRPHADVGPLRKRAKGPAIMVLTAALVISPWTARNYHLSGHFIPISRGVIARALWFGTWVRNYDHVYNDPTGRHLAVPNYAFKLPGEHELFDRWKLEEDDQATRDKVFFQMFKDRFKSEPAHVVYVWFRRAPANWIGSSRFDVASFRPASLARGTPLFIVAKGSLYMLNLALCGLGWLGLLLVLWKRDWKLVWFALPLLYTEAVFLPIDCMEPRYTQPILPCVVLLACYVLQLKPVRGVFGRMKRRLLPAA